MSQLLESRLTQEQREECARNDAKLIADLLPLSPIPIQPTDSEGDLQIQMQGYIGEVCRG